MASTALNTSRSQSIDLQIPGESYSLTLLRETDIEDLQAILSLDSVNHNLIRVPKPYTLAIAESWVMARVASNVALLSIPTLAARNEAFFAQTHAVPLQAIRHTPSGEFVGSVSLTPRPSTHNIVELGYYLDPAHHGKKIMVTAAKVVLKWAKEEFGVENIYGSGDGVNLKSRNVMQRVVRETAIGDVMTGRKIMTWPVEKVVMGREIESECSTWEWKI